MYNYVIRQVIVLKNNKSVSKRVLSLVMSVVLVVSTFMSVMVVDASVCRRLLYF